MMKKTHIFVIALTIISQLYEVNLTSPTDEELEVILQFFEFDLEDVCIAESEVLWDFFSGNKTDLSELLKLELKKAELYKNETKTHVEFTGRSFDSNRLQRLLDIFTNPGAPLLEVSELKEYKEYSVKLQEIVSGMTLDCSEGNNEGKEKKCVPQNARVVNKILANEKDEKMLKQIWSQWHEEFETENKRMKFDFMHQLSILDMEAEQNEEDELSNYWLKQSDMPHLDYHKLSQMWKEIIPLYQKLRKFMAGVIERNYGNSAIIDNKIFPMHLLGSLKPRGWIAAAEKLGAFDNAKSYRSLKSKLSRKNFHDLHKLADNFTSEIKLGDLPPEFYENSRFNVASPFCQARVFDYCTRKNVLRAMSCSDEDVTLEQFIRIHEDVAKLKHLMAAGRETQEEENGFMFREGPRDSIIYEAVAGLSSMTALSPKNLRTQNLLPITNLPNEETVSLLLAALDIIPSLPYYLVADMWRINALKEMDATLGETSAYESSSTSAHSSTWTVAYEENESSSSSPLSTPDDEETGKLHAENHVVDHNNKNGIEHEVTDSYSDDTSVTKEWMHVTESSTIGSPKIYDFQNLTADWWKYREQMQGIGNSDGKLYADFLQDEHIIWNKPYVSKFLGKILQFQLLNHFETLNSTTKANKLQSLLQVGKSKPTKEILMEMFSISEISAEPLLQYFKPLEAFLDAGGTFKNQAASDSSDISLFSDSYSMNGSPDSDESETQKGSNTIAFSLLILTALGIVLVAVFITLKRYRAKKKAKERRKRLNASIS